jgi:hypothetical protein
MIQLRIEKLPEGVYLAPSEEVQGLVVQGRMIQETVAIGGLPWIPADCGLLSS